MVEGKRARFAQFAWGTVAIVVLVIAWGAFVRATGSGAGCGDHWPLCNGELVPRSAQVATYIEFSHRVTSAFSVIAVAGLYWLSRRTFENGHLARKAAGASLLFVLGEAGIGAFLVLYKLVAGDQSMARGYSIMLHLGNTFFLLASLVLTTHAAKIDARTYLSWKGTERITRMLAIVPLVLLFVVGTSGAIAALGDTLFPSDTLAEGFAQDSSPTAHIFLRLRVLHPVFALVCGLVVMSSGALLRYLRFGQRAIVNLSRITSMLFLAQFCVGVANLFLRAPVAMQLFHLIMADFVWLAAARLCLEAFTVSSLEPSAISVSNVAPTKQGIETLQLTDPS